MTEGGGVYLGTVTRGRDNNLNLIRFLAATAVLVSHAWPITGGPGTPEPLKTLTGHSLGGLAVYMFFAISGFLVTASFHRSRSAQHFVQARARRLFPGLAVSLLLVALVMGPLVTTLPIGQFLTDPLTLTFLLRNITLAFPQYTLPGVFTDNPYTAVEGSIWTLIHEVLCYGLVFLAGMAGLLWRPKAMAVTLALVLGLWLVLALVPLPVPDRLMKTHDLALPFLFGVVFFLVKDRLRLGLPGVAGLIVLAGGARGLGLTGPLYDVLLVLALSYTTFWAAYVPGGVIRRFNRLGDYSYGIYIYAFPLQGLAVWLFGAQSAWTNIALAFPATLVCAILSWHWIEAPALQHRSLRHRLQ